MAGSKKRDPDGPFLPPIEEPQDPVMRQMYAAQIASMGRVISPVKVHSARLPTSFLQFYGKVGELDGQLTVPRELALLVRQRVASINVCLFCMDSNRAYTIMNSLSQAKFDALNDYQTSPLFSEAERAALDYVTKLTREKRMDPATFDRLAEHYSEREICEIVYLASSEHIFNMTNIGLNIHSDMLCDVVKKRQYEQANKPV